MFHFKFCRRGQQDPIDFFTTLSSGENDDRKKFPTEEKEALLEPFNLVLQSWMFCNKDWKLTQVLVLQFMCRTPNITPEV